MDVLDNHLFFPIVSPLLGGAIIALLRPPTRWVRMVFLLLLTAQVGYTWWLLWRVVDDGRQVTIAAGWSLPDGIVLLADGLSAIMLMLSILVFLGGWLFATVMGSVAPSWGENEYPVLCFLLGSLSGVYLAGDGLSLVIWSEAVMLALFLVLIHRGAQRQLGVSLKYLVFHIVGSTLMFAGCAMLYRITGTTSFALLAEAFEGIGGGAEGEHPITANLFFLACITLTTFPMFVWSPSVVHAIPVARSSLLMGLLNCHACYLLFRLYSLLFAHDLPRFSPALVTLSGLAMAGFLVAAIQKNIRDVFAWVSIGQLGYIVLGIDNAGAAALSAGLLLLIHTTLVTTGVFLLSGTLEHLAGGANFKRMRDLLSQRPVWIGLLGIGLATIVGFPPSGVFFGRVALLNTTILYQNYVAAAILVFGSVLIVLPLFRIWQHLCGLAHVGVKPTLGSAEPKHLPTARGIWVAGLLIGTSVILTIWTTSVLDYCSMAAIQAFDGPGYADDVRETLSLLSGGR